MSRIIDDEVPDFELDDLVFFTAPNGNRLLGTVVRVYNTRDLYHVLADDHRYEVDPREDRMRLHKLTLHRRKQC